MSAAKRFFDDEELRNACVDFVASYGEEAFFSQPYWRAELFRFTKKYRQENKIREALETEDEQVQAIQNSLIRSKQLIEEFLSGHTVRHLCYPWVRYSVLAASLSRECGYVSAFIDINPQKPFPNWNSPYTVQRVLPINEYGDDPHQITRIDARDNMVLSLPGRKRLSYAQRFFTRLISFPTS
jgi:hypothetical protein